MTYPNVYTINCMNVIGSLGVGSFEIEQPVCKKCKRTLIEEIKYSSIEYLLDSYNNEDMFSAYGQLIVSEKLNQSLYSDSIKGFAPLKTSIKPSEFYEGEFPSGDKFYYLAILPPAVKNVPIAYDFEGTCIKCNYGIIKKDSYRRGLLIRTDVTDAEPLKIDSKSWNGNDIFNLSDHGEIGVTQNFLDVIKKFNCPELLTFPAEWI